MEDDKGGRQKEKGQIGGEDGDARRHQHSHRGALEKYVREQASNLIHQGRKIPRRISIPPLGYGVTGSPARHSPGSCATRVRYWDGVHHILGRGGSPFLFLPSPWRSKPTGQARHRDGRPLPCDAADARPHFPWFPPSTAGQERKKEKKATKATTINEGGHIESDLTHSPSGCKPLTPDLILFPCHSLDFFRTSFPMSRFIDSGLRRERGRGG